MEEAASITPQEPVAESPAAAIVSRRRREIARIIEEEQERIVQCAVNHYGIWARRTAVRRWKYAISGKAQLLILAQQGVRGLLHRNLRKGCNGWTAFILERVAAITQLRAAAMGFRNRGLKKAMNLLIAQQQERNAKLASLKRAASSWVNSALRRGWRKLVVLGAMRRKLKLAARSMLFRNRRKGWNGWIAMMIEKTKKMMLLRSAAASFQNRALRKGWNGWEAMRAERIQALARMQHAALCFAQRAIRSGYRAWLPLIQQRGAMKKAMIAFKNRASVQAFNSWVQMIVIRAEMLVRMRSSAMALSQGAYFACWLTWKETVEEARTNLQRLRSAVDAMMGGKLRAAFNSLANRKEASADEFTRFERAGRMWAAGAIGTGFKNWVAYAAAQKLLPEGGRPRPISPNAKKRVKWARTVLPHCIKREITGDDKYVCQRSLLTPYAALVLRFDGAVLRVVNVHRPPSEPLCTIDLTRGFDELMLSESPADARAENVLLAAPRGTRISAGALNAPHHLLIVPNFFGGVLRLSNDLDVRVVDARFEPSKAPLDPDDDPTTYVPEKVLTQVLLTLVDGSGDSVGRPSWTHLNQLLELLPKAAYYACETHSEDDLRKKRRLELHRSEQRRLALHHLRLASRRGEVPTAWGEGVNSSPLGGGGSTMDFEEGSPLSGVGGLVRQIEEAAPSRLLGEPLGDARRHVNQAGFSGGNVGGLLGFGGGHGRGAAAAHAEYVAAAGGGAGAYGRGGKRMGMVSSTSAKAFTSGYDDSRMRPSSAHFR